MYFQANGFSKAGKGVVWDALAAVAHEHSYHPVRDYLGGLRWDGTGRVGKLFLQYFNAELPDDPVERDRHCFGRSEPCLAHPCRPCLTPDLAALVSITGLLEGKPAAMHEAVEGQQRDGGRQGSR